MLVSRSVRFAFVFAFAASVIPVLGAAQQMRAVAGPSYAFTNGQWLIGDKFERRTRWSVNGVLTDAAPARVDSTVDLRGGWVVPPFADAHTHNLDGPFNLDSVRARYVREGTFYVQVLTNSRSGADQVRARWNRPCELDVAYANAGLTSTLSHPFLAYEPRAMGLYDGSQWAAHAAEIRVSRKAEGRSYVFLDSLADVEKKWPEILASHPDIVKIFLLDAMEHPPAMSDTGLPSGHGLRPSLVPEIVRRAHAAGIRVAAHIETAQDFALAVRAGVDLFAHLPGYEMEPGGDTTRFQIDEETARLAGARGVAVTPTLTLAGLSNDVDTTRAAANRRVILRLQARNIRLLRRHGVHIIVGSDWFGRTAAAERQAFAATGIWTPVEMLRAWGEETSRAIFPRRRIGRLEDGWEASFLVFPSDPTRGGELPPIALRVKQGCMIE